LLITGVLWFEAQVLLKIVSEVSGGRERIEERREIKLFGQGLTFSVRKGLAVCVDGPQAWRELKLRLSRA
jgi:hypothetical protein